MLWGVRNVGTLAHSEVCREGVYRDRYHARNLYYRKSTKTGRMLSDPTKSKRQTKSTWCDRREGMIEMATQIQKRPNVYMKEFTRVLAETADISEINAEYLTEAFLQTIATTLVENQSICFPDFGVFELQETTERVGRNPRTKEECVIPARLKPVFRPAKSFRDAMNKAALETSAEDEETA